MVITKKVRAAAFLLAFLTVFYIFIIIPSPVFASESEEDIAENNIIEESDGEEFEDYEDYEEEEIEIIEEIDEEAIRLMRIEELEELIDEAKWKVIAAEYTLKSLQKEIYNHRYEERVERSGWVGRETTIVDRKSDLLDRFAGKPGILGLQELDIGYLRHVIQYDHKWSGQPSPNAYPPYSAYYYMLGVGDVYRAIEAFHEKNAYYLGLEAELYEQLFLILSWEYELLELHGAKEFQLIIKEIDLVKAELLYLQTKTAHDRDMLEYAARTDDAVRGRMSHKYPDWNRFLLNPAAPEFNHIRNMYSNDYLYTSAHYEEMRTEYVERLIAADAEDRIREIEDYLKGPIVKKALYAQMLDLRNVYREIEAEFQEELDTSAAGWVLYNRKASDLLKTRYINDNLENKLREFIDGSRDSEAYRIYAEDFGRLIALMRRLDEYTGRMVELSEEYFKDYLEDARSFRNRNYTIDTYEEYYPFLNFNESDHLYWFLDWERESAQIWGERVIPGTGYRVINQPVIDSLKTSLRGLESYLMAWAVRKADAGNILSSTELYWYRLWRSRTDISVGKVSEEEFFGALPYYLIVGALSLTETLMGFFEIAAGTKNISYDGKPMKLFDAFFQNPAVSYAFWGLTVIGLALLIFIAIGSVSKHAMNLGSEKSLGATLGQIGRSALAFLLAPVVMLSSIHIVATVMEQTDRAFDRSNGAASVTRSVFVMSTLEAGRDEVVGSMKSPVRQKFLSGQYDYKNRETAAKYFRLGELDLLLALLLSGILIFMYIALICIFILRIFYILLLYLACPLFIPSLAAGEGAMFKKWRELFISKLLTGFGLVISVKLMTYILPVILLGDYKLGPEGFGDLIVKFVFVIGSVFAVVKSSGVITSIVYPEGDSTEDMVFGAMKDKVLYIAKKVKDAVETAIKAAFNAARLVVMGDASGLVSQIKEEAEKKAKQAAESVGKVTGGATQGGGKDGG